MRQFKSGSTFNNNGAAASSSEATTQQQLAPSVKLPRTGIDQIFSGDRPRFIDTHREFERVASVNVSPSSLLKLLKRLRGDATLSSAAKNCCTLNPNSVSLSVPRDSRLMSYWLLGLWRGALISTGRPTLFATENEHLGPSLKCLTFD